MLDKWGGFGSIFVRGVRRLGFDDIGIWGLGSVTRWFFVSLSNLWGWLPTSLRRLSPVQVLRLHSMRLHHWRLAEQGFSGVSGLMSKGRWLVVDGGITRTFCRSRAREDFVSYISKPQGKEIAWNSEALVGARIVVSGGHDSTFPYQLDSRYAQTSAEESERLVASIRRSGISRWYAENLTSYDDIFAPIPGGILPSPWRDSVRFVRSRPRRQMPSKLVFCAHRDKGGQRAHSQFDVRRHVTDLAQGPWRSFTTVPEDYLSIAAFRRELRAHSFTLCVEGGGIDPSPKAFEALMQGSIPIIRESPLADAYRHFPVLVVRDWVKEALSDEILAGHLDETMQSWPDWFDVTERMKLGYWLHNVMEGIGTRRQSL